MGEDRRIVYIGGLGKGRSGSTLLAALIAQSVEQSVSVGELRSVWRVAERDELCGCGQKFSACEFWQAIGAEGGSLWRPAHVRRMLTLSELCCRHRSVALRTARLRRRDRDVQELRHSLARLYRAIVTVAKAPVVIDSTKDPGYAAMLRGVEGFRLDVVHLVRDPRAVAAAMMKVRTRPEVASVSTLMPRARSLRTAAEWVVDNAWFDAQRRHGISSVRIRYEDLATAPSGVLASLMTELQLGRGAATERLDSVDFGARAAHSVGGNPARFAGRAPVRLDDAWRYAGMRWTDRVAVVGVAWPLMMRYRYLSGRDANHRAPA